MSQWADRPRTPSDAPVTGRVEALALAATGRRVALEELQGPGVDVLGSRLARSLGS